MQHQAMLAAYPQPQPPAEWYDTDCGSKKTMARTLADSSCRIAIMRSGTVRFKQAHGRMNSGTPFGMYKVDTAHRKDLATGVRDSRRFHAASFNAAALDRDCGYKSAAPDVVYDVSVLTDGMPATLADTVEHSPTRCAILRSKQAKCAPGERTAAPDVYYNADTLNKASLATSVKESPVRYGNMRCSRTKRGGLGQGTACSTDIGPGTYDFPQQRDLRTSLLLNQNPLSSMASNGPRLANDKVDPSRNLGSVWKQEYDVKRHWNQGVRISRAEYLRPQYMPASYAQV